MNLIVAGRTSATGKPVIARAASRLLFYMIVGECMAGSDMADKGIGGEADWAAKLKNETDAWRRRRMVPSQQLTPGGIPVVRRLKRKRANAGAVAAHPLPG
ncbi:hypothetical protein [Bradyrhizobium neotropicale]|uniref:hypothetical protein n=1 Tax=Bradyrhizobium neotropicale TaxID=1497615 RepID=UPI001AD60EE5|nr:hypothetical protein [Bradyrhizobium neotropicale]MBO4223215.1 hypothetical protein [Bradyrhizobium neotropicale]